MRNTTFYKELTLVFPKAANSLGVTAEQPTFISVDARAKMNCQTCGVESTALQYEVGSIVMAQHFHHIKTVSSSGGGGGGIYHYASNHQEFLHRNSYLFANRWLAIVEPVGELDFHDYGDGTKIVRSEGVEVKKIETRNTAGVVLYNGLIDDSGNSGRGLFSREFDTPLDPLEHPPTLRYYTQLNGSIAFEPLVGYSPTFEKLGEE